MVVPGSPDAKVRPGPVAQYGRASAGLWGGAGTGLSRAEGMRGLLYGPYGPYNLRHDAWSPLRV